MIMRLDWIKNRGKTWLIGSSVLLLLVVGWLLYTKGPLGATKVTVAKVQKQAFKAGVFGIGTVDARLTYAIGPTQARRVFKVFADQGDKVAAGKVLGDGPGGPGTKNNECRRFRYQVAKRTRCATLRQS